MIEISFWLGVIVGVTCTLMIEAICVALLWCIVRIEVTRFEKKQYKRKESHSK